MFVAFRDARTGLEFLRSCRELWERGLWLTLDAYQGHAFWEFREIHDGSSGQWRRLAERLGGRGVPSLETALRDLQLEPVHAPLRAIFEGGHVTAVLERTATPEDLDVLEARFAAFLGGVVDATGVAGVAWRSGRRSPPASASARPRPSRRTPADLERADRAALLGWLALSRTGELAPGADVAATSAAWFDELRLAPVLAVGFRGAGLDEAAAWAAADQVRVLLSLPRPSEIRARGAVAADARLLERWTRTTTPSGRRMGINTWEGVEWLDRDRFEALLGWAVRLDAIDAGGAVDRVRVERMAAAAAAAGYRLDRLVAPANATTKRSRSASGASADAGSTTVEPARPATRPKRPKR